MIHEHGRPAWGKHAGRPPRIVPRHPDERITMTEPRQTVLTVTVTTRPDGGHYFDQADFTGHITEWVRAALKGKHAVDEVTIAPAAVPVPPPADQTALPLTAVERQFLTFALDLASDEMASRGDEFTADDEDALEKLRRVAAEEQPAEADDTVHTCPGRWGGPDCRCFDDNPKRPAVGEQPETQETPRG